MPKEIIHNTSDYDKFKLSQENRNVDLGKATSKKLRKSMERYGWLRAFPAMCRNTDNGKLEIVDGQHRYSIARELGIPVKYVIDNSDIDVAQVNEGQATWKVEDYLNRWLKADKDAYKEIEEMKETHPRIPLSMCIAFLGGSYSFNSTIRDNFQAGAFKVKDKGRAYRIANLYEKIVDINENAKHRNFLKALYACFFVDDFDQDRFLESCKKRPFMIQAYSKREDFLEMIEEIYNYHTHTGRIPVKFQAEEAMRKKMTKQ